MSAGDSTVILAPVADEMLARLGDFVGRNMGLHFPRERWPELVRGIRHAAVDFGFNDDRPFIEWLLSARLTKEQVELLAGHLTVGETYFYRGRQAFDALTEEILPALVRDRIGRDQRIRMWSAGCCTGEEPYSMAIAASRTIPDLKNWHVTILATDINRRFLRKAEAGVYGAWSFRDAPPWLRDRYFTTKVEGRNEIASWIRQMVTFFPLNLASDAYPSLLNDTNAMDLILCRNVMMYFTQEHMADVVEKLRHCLVEGGWLLVSPNEVSSSLFSKFEAVHFRDMVFYRKPKADGAVTIGDAAMPAAMAAPATPTQDLESSVVETAHELYSHGFFAEAKNTLATGAESPRAMVLMARSLANEGRLAESLAWCDKAVAAAGMDPAMHFLRATVLHEQGNGGGAAEAYRRALYLDHDFALAHFALGNLCRERGQHREARRHFRNALNALKEIPPDSALPESEGVTAGRLAEIVRVLLESETTHAG